MPGPSSSTTSLACRRGSRWKRGMCVQVAMAERIVEQVEDQPVQVVAGNPRSSPALDRPLRRDLDARSDLGKRVGEALARSSRAARLQAADVGARQQQQIRDEPAHAARGAQRDFADRPLAVELVASSSRLASTLVSGVRSPCEASATNSRWRAKAASLSARARRAPRASIRAYAPTRPLVLGLGLGSAASGRGSLDLTRCLCQLDDGTHPRWARADLPASQIAPPSTPPPRKIRTRRMVSSSWTGAARK